LTTIIILRRSRSIAGQGAPVDLLWNQQQWRPIIAPLIRRIEARFDRIGIPLVPRRLKEIARFGRTEYDGQRLRPNSLLRQGSARYYHNPDDNQPRAGGVSACAT
jgi:hypothetical protein